MMMRSRWSVVSFYIGSQFLIITQSNLSRKKSESKKWREAGISALTRLSTIWLFIQITNIKLWNECDQSISTRAKNRIQMRIEKWMNGSNFKNLRKCERGINELILIKRKKLLLLLLIITHIFLCYSISIEIYFLEKYFSFLAFHVYSLFLSYLFAWMFKNSNSLWKKKLVM